MREFQNPLSGAESVPEGAVYTLMLGDVTDPGTDPVTTWVVHWGDGSTDTYTADGFAAFDAPCDSAGWLGPITELACSAQA